MAININPGVIERPIYWTMNPFSHIRELHKIMQGKYVVNNCRFPDFLILSALYLKTWKLNMIFFLDLI